MITVIVALCVLGSFGLIVFFGAPYVPTLSVELKRAFTELYAVGKNDVVVDLGSGDGRVLKEAVRHGASGVGYELNPFLFVISKLRVRSKAVVHLRDMWSVTLPANTTLVYVFTVSRDVGKLSRFIQKQVDANGRGLHVMTFGPQFIDRKPVKTLRGHALYEIEPSQHRSA